MTTDPAREAVNKELRFWLRFVGLLAFISVGSVVLFLAITGATCMGWM